MIKHDAICRHDCICFFGVVVYGIENRDSLSGINSIVNSNSLGGFIAESEISIFVDFRYPSS